jgi:hypothetical protein
MNKELLKALADLSRLQDLSFLVEFILGKQVLQIAKKTYLGLLNHFEYLLVDSLTAIPPSHQPGASIP